MIAIYNFFHVLLLRNMLNAFTALHDQIKQTRWVYEEKLLNV